MPVENLASVIIGDVLLLRLLISIIYADDLMFFCKGNSSFVNSVLRSLVTFAKTYGLSANLGKSANALLQCY